MALQQVRGLGDTVGAGAAFLAAVRADGGPGRPRPGQAEAGWPRELGLAIVLLVLVVILAYCGMPVA